MFGNNVTLSAKPDWTGRTTAFGAVDVDDPIRPKRPIQKYRRMAGKVSLVLSVRSTTQRESVGDGRAARKSWDSRCRLRFQFHLHKANSASAVSLSLGLGSTAPGIDHSAQKLPHTTTESAMIASPWGHE